MKRAYSFPKVTNIKDFLIPVLVEMIVWSYKHDPEAGADFFNQATQNRELLLKNIFEALE